MKAKRDRKLLFVGSAVPLRSAFFAETQSAELSLSLASSRFNTMNVTRSVAYLLLSSTVLFGVLHVSAQAQVAPASNDANTVVTLSGNTFDVTGGTTAGTNLFHSFQTFGLNAEQIANFRSNPAIQNILGRVVGGDASIINGLVRVTGSNANLYLVNPAGIVFGANARLDVAGSFTATTANGIGFGNRWFNAIGSNDYANLIGSPNSFAFTMVQPGAIVNAGNLAVGQGQSITLLGGTVINTGTLTAPGGNIIVAAVAGEKLVRVSQSGSLLNLELPTETKVAINPSPFTPLSLPELLTGGNLSNATGLTVENGTVKLTGSGVIVEAGDIVANTVSAQTATLSAANNLILMESELSTTGNLSLLAQNTVQIRDSAAKPALIQAGGNLTIQGNQAIDIFALNHADSGLVSGGDMVLRSTTSIAGDAHYWAGGNFTIEKLDGKPGSLTSPYDPVILALGSVRLDSYSGTSLHILAGGSVTLGNVSITDAGAVAETINPGNGDTAPFNGVRPISSLAKITRADGSRLYVNVAPTLDSAGNVQRNALSTDQLEIDGSQKPTLDIRAGVDWTQLTNLSTNQILGTVTASFTDPPTANITINSISVRATTAPFASGVVLLTNQYMPNRSLAGGAIEVTGVIDPTPGARPISIAVAGSRESPSTIVIDSRATITTGTITGGSSDDNQGYASIALSALGNITTGDLVAGRSFSSSLSSVVLSSAQGNVIVSTINAGAYGIDVRAAGLFQAYGTLSEGFQDNFVRPLPGTQVRQFLDSKGIPVPDPNVQLRVGFATSPPISVIGRPIGRSAGLPDAPITIQYGDGTQLLVNQTFPISQLSNPPDPTTIAVGRIVIKGGKSTALDGGPLTSRIIPGDDNFVNLTGFSNGKPIVEPITTSNFTVSLASRLTRNEQYTARQFGTSDFPVTASGFSGVVVIASGGDNSFYGSVQSLQFTPIVKPDEIAQQPTQQPSSVVPPVDRLAALRQQFQGEDGQVAQRQLTAQVKGSACDTSVVATVPSGNRGGGTGKVPSRITSGAASAETGCNQSSDDSQILKLLEEEPVLNQSKQLDLVDPNVWPQRAETDHHLAPTR